MTASVLDRSVDRNLSGRRVLRNVRRGRRVRRPLRVPPLPDDAFGEPILRSVFDVYLDGDRLTRFKDPCAPEDVARTFFLHLFPVDAADLSAEERAGEYNLRDFAFRKHGDMLYGKRSMTVALPACALYRIRTGQYAFDRSWAWRKRYDFPR